MHVDWVPSQVWSEGPKKRELALGRVDVWRVRLDEARRDDVCLSPTEAQRGVLAPDERARAARFHFDRDRVRFQRCRTALRLLLARYLDIAPSDIRFAYGPSGKPELDADQNRHELRFNVSHSGDMALIAFGIRNNLGADIEKVRPDVNTAELSERYFSTRERESLRSLPEALRVIAFYACWARKEAFLKATGEGLGFPLSDFSVAVHPEKAPSVEEIKGDTSAARQWSLIDIRAADGFRSAVAVEHPSVTLATFDLSASSL